ncbi:Secondary metabolism regulator LAE1 [Fusarium oxysporum f. sp. albedinis]|nr:Secondary metabolism regulator LAE1 [Fusarium oxysporum f. sp. albedinis]
MPTPELTLLREKARRELTSRARSGVRKTRKNLPKGRRLTQSRMVVEESAGYEISNDPDNEITPGPQNSVSDERKTHSLQSEIMREIMREMLSSLVELTAVLACSNLHRKILAFSCTIKPPAVLKINASKLNHFIHELLFSGHDYLPSAILLPNRTWLCIRSTAQEAITLKSNLSRRHENASHESPCGQALRSGDSVSRPLLYSQSDYATKKVNTRLSAHHKSLKFPAM